MTSEEKEKLYTLRWNINKYVTEQKLKDELLDILGDLLGDKKILEDRPTSFRQLWYPSALKNFPKSKTRGHYATASGFPIGAIVHFTAGHPGLEDRISEQVLNGFTFFVIDDDGKIGQNFPLNEWGYHAGESKWPGLGSYVSNKLVGIEIACAGMLTKIDDNTYRSWFGKEYTKDQVRYISSDMDNQQAGYYHKYTAAQEKSLIELLAWLKHNDPDFKTDYVLGHDEVSGKKGIGYNRKNDPGGSLSMTMSNLRKLLLSM